MEDSANLYNPEWSMCEKGRRLADGLIPQKNLREVMDFLRGIVFFQDVSLEEMTNAACFLIVAIVNEFVDASILQKQQIIDKVERVYGARGMAELRLKLLRNYKVEI